MVRSTFNPAVAGRRWSRRVAAALLGLGLGLWGSSAGPGARSGIGPGGIGPGIELGAGLGMRPALGAERISINLGILGDSFQVSSLETYATTGEVPPDLRDYIRFLDEAQQAQLRQSLIAEADVSVVAVSQFLYSPQGEELLKRLGQVIQSEARQSGFSGIRAALILAAADPEGITLLKVLQKFPTQGIRINLGRGWEIAKELGDLVEQSQAATAAIEAQAQTEAAMEAAAGIEVADLASLALDGPWAWRREQLMLRDRSRDRRLPVDVYLPQGNPQGNRQGNRQDDLAIVEIPPRPAQPWPTVIISHGLNSDRSSFAYLAEHLASQGYAVIVPEHPGSNAEQVRALLEGRADEVADPAEFVNRPLDITYLLDTLGQDPQFAPQLNLRRVGIVGQSFGGYTALALGGARVNEALLQRSCAQLDESWNVSLALQCRALAVRPIPENLQDPRIAAIVAINPFMSAVFGPEGLASLAVPTLIVGGDSDTVAPALLEQIQPFRWIQGPERHLALILGGTHFSTIAVDPDSNEIPLPELLLGRDLPLARSYAKALSLATFEIYLTAEAARVPYLSSSAGKALERGKLGLAIVRMLPQ